MVCSYYQHRSDVNADSRRVFIVPVDAVFVSYMRVSSLREKPGSADASGIREAGILALPAMNKFLMVWYGLQASNVRTWG